ncbi:hypothetical protein BXZ70DRAFT_183083 [Cristinia sonorae]|uniref:F-box domain-containing protein n=1 Tax=Cristinia sonorae TaxID=1940300 RepID=A0A8K0UP06_9AGAR|nr:hypothetical protein BXZ70DRAFT_183083 [Cristinia sonorae]
MQLATSNDSVEKPQPNSSPLTDSSGLNIPGDIADNIFRYLEDDRATLVSCGLVTRTWTYFSHRRVFRTVTLRMKPFVAHKSTSDLLRFFQQKPEISSFVQELQLIGNSRFPTPICIPYHLVKLLDALPNLQDLAITQA